MAKESWAKDDEAVEELGAPEKVEVEEKPTPAPAKKPGPVFDRGKDGRLIDTSK